MDRDIGPARVIVGVHDSLTGQSALREGVRLARAMRTTMRAVRACAGPRQEAGAGWGPAQAWTAPAHPIVWEAAERQALDFIRYVFGESLGGMPRGVLVEAAVAFAPAWEALPGCVNATDILVVGASRQHWRPLSRPVADYCTAHAPCPVLVVPRHPASRQLALGAGVAGWLRRRRELPAAERLALPAAVSRARPQAH